jgi:iron(III) transport system substrate-binding protein
VSGAGVAQDGAEPCHAIRFLEYLASDAAQVYFADGNNEWPVVATARSPTPALEALGGFKADTLPNRAVGAADGDGAKGLDRAGWR